jgi:hypothetical protein
VLVYDIGDGSAPWVNRRMGVREAGMNGSLSHRNLFWLCCLGSSFGLAANQRLAGLERTRHAAGSIFSSRCCSGHALVLWEGITRGLQCAAGGDAAALHGLGADYGQSTDILWADFQQTFSRR